MVASAKARRNGERDRVTKIIYIEHDGTEHIADVANGSSVMEGALANGIDGITADCGGCCACATCHVYIEKEWWDRVEAPQEFETSMLESAVEPRESSRLSCQIKISDALEGLKVHLPASQY